MSPLLSSRHRILYFNSRFDAFFDVNVEVTLVLPLGCSVTERSISREKFTVLGCVALRWAASSQSSTARVCAMCEAATSVTPFSMSDFEKNALKAFAPLPQVTKKTGSAFVPCVSETCVPLPGRSPCGVHSHGELYSLPER
jgi:hypothetical protein